MDPRKAPPEHLVFRRRPGESQDEFWVRCREAVDQMVADQKARELVHEAAES